MTAISIQSNCKSLNISGYHKPYRTQNEGITGSNPRNCSDHTQHSAALWGSEFPIQWKYPSSRADQLEVFLVGEGPRFRHLDFTDTTERILEL